MILRLHRWTTLPAGAVALGLLAVILWSGSTLTEKLLLRQIPPLTLLTWQLISSLLMLWGLVFSLRLPRPDGRSFLRQGWPGLIQPGLANMLFLFGLALVKANVFSFLTAAEAPLGILFAYLILGERLNRPVVFLTGAATAGVFLVALNVSGDGVRNTAEGVVLILCGTVFASLYGTASRASVTAPDTHPLVLTAVQQLFSLAVVLVVWCLWPGAGGELSRFAEVSASLWAWAALAGVFQYAVPFWLYLLALRSMGASDASLLLIWSPLFVAVGAFLILGEGVTAVQLYGASMTVLSMTAIAWQQRTAPPGPPVVRRRRRESE